ncbi:MAG: hypothetical protein WBA54_04560 [Acidaminobacteraceae bacterium]
MKNILKITLVSLLILLVVLVFNSKNTSIELSLENNSGETTTDFFLYLANSTTPQSIPNIEPNDTYVTTIKYDKSQDEDSLRLFYHDYNGEKNDIILIDSFKKGYIKKLKIDIIDIDENGVYTLEIL